MTAATHAAFFRNLNLGHRGSPDGRTLVAAFGGEAVAESFQTNGTVVFRADDGPAALRDACARLAAAGFGHEAQVRSLADLEEARAAEPPVDPSENVYRTVLSLFDADPTPLAPLPLRSPNSLVEVRVAAPTSAWSVCWKPRSTAGDVNGFLERLLGVPVTTRTAGTLARLLARYRGDTPAP